ncbi:MAG: thiamine phosphate synthase, partial [bacterium]
RDLPPLLVITDRQATRGRPLAEVVRAALAGGARFFQLREKGLEGGALLALAEELLAETRRHGAKLLINDRIDVALAAGADGIVLPADSFPTAVARQLVGPHKLVGRSTHSATEVQNAAREGCDFVLFGPIYDTPSKGAFGEPQGVERLREVTSSKIPVFAVGGIQADRVPELVSAGAAGGAVIREVMSAADPAAAVRELYRGLVVSQLN